MNFSSSALVQSVTLQEEGSDSRDFSCDNGIGDHDADSSLRSDLETDWLLCPVYKWYVSLLTSLFGVA